MKERLSAVAEETLLTLAPLDLSLDPRGGRRAGDAEAGRAGVPAKDRSRELEFIGGGDEEKPGGPASASWHSTHDEETVSENELSLRLLPGATPRPCGHQQFHGTDIITVRVGHPGRR